jgi:hypothetical protein
MGDHDIAHCHPPLPAVSKYLSRRHRTYTSYFSVYCVGHCGTSRISPP